MTHRILCVDGDKDASEDTAETIRSQLADLDPVVETAGTLADAEALLGTDTDVIVTEYDLSDGTGFDIVSAAEDVCPDAGVILYTDTDPGTLDTIELRGAITEYVGKDSVFGEERLADLVRTTIETRSQGSYPMPQTEAERLAALQSFDLDDEELIESLDRITDLAAAHFDVEQASINLITEYSQEFLACYGEAEDWKTMDREDSICTFTILEESGVMAVEDVTEDPRFQSRADSLIELGIRAYMGANLITSNGLVIGPLCIYDDEPRSFSPAEKAYLRDLAAVAMDLIEYHTQLRAVGDIEEADQ
ncbi:putative GAF sensor protein [Halorhabdus utahensis DSM 12940]|uniref:Putative GAF sensor protein n=1 Tax=Halorhabdus utahensis (strain DSM 12940 / JCM 11049 / AX-2) TaxID=519442 RepID=C7NVJ3_HALUD|nr:GAF domain-containing protein [Halorhabdus utahensis]ACV12516.1 putative GAF sensor protein [Halorhabdus utahensis DSM 12940]